MSVPTPPPQDKRHRRHSPKTVKLVQDMYAGGWTPIQLQRYLAKSGIEVAESTIRRWAIPVEGEGHRQLNRQLMRERRRRELKARKQRIQRMRDLRDVGLSLEDVARVMNLDHPGLGLTRSSVDAVINEGRVPRVLREAA